MRQPSRSIVFFAELDGVAILAPAKQEKASGATSSQASNVASEQLAQHPWLLGAFADSESSDGEGREEPEEVPGAEANETAQEWSSDGEDELEGDEEIEAVFKQLHKKRVEWFHGFGVREVRSIQEQSL